MSRQPKDARLDRGRKSVLMSTVDGWAMVRRPGCVPYILSEKEWLKLPALSTSQKDKNDE